MPVVLRKENDCYRFVSIMLSFTESEKDLVRAVVNRTLGLVGKGHLKRSRVKLI